MPRSFFASFRTGPVFSACMFRGCLFRLIRLLPFQMFKYFKCCIHRCPPQPAFQKRMVSDGQKIKALWDDNKDVLMGMVLGSLASMPVNIYWKRRPDVTQGLIVESSFTLPSIVANGVLKNGKCHITLKAANSESGSVLASQVAGWQASATTFPSKPFSAFPRSRTPRLGGRAAHVQLQAAGPRVE